MSTWQRFDLISLVVANYHCPKEYYPMFMYDYIDTWRWRWFYLVKCVLCIWLNLYIHPSVDLNVSTYEGCFKYNFKRFYSYDGEGYAYSILQIGTGVFKNWWYFIDQDW